MEIIGFKAETTAVAARIVEQVEETKTAIGPSPKLTHSAVAMHLIDNDFGPLD